MKVWSVLKLNPESFFWVLELEPHNHFAQKQFISSMWATAQCIYFNIFNACRTNVDTVSVLEKKREPSEQLIRLHTTDFEHQSNSSALETELWKGQTAFPGIHVVVAKFVAPVVFAGSFSDVVQCPLHMTFSYGTSFNCASFTNRIGSSNSKAIAHKSSWKLWPVDVPSCQEITPDERRIMEYSQVDSTKACE